MKRAPLFAAIAVFGMPIVPQYVLAQDGILEEVIVTARKREESLQEAPVAVSAMSGDMLTEMGARDVSDLRKVIPNLDVYDGNGTGGAGNFFIRGVGARNTGVNFDSGVGIYFDGVYVSRPDGALLHITDVQSIQVLRGPQGTLFGKNTTGGAILYTMNKPNEEWEGSVQVTAGNYNRLDGKAVVNVPFSDSVWGRFALSSVNRDGYVENVVTGEDYTDTDRQSGMAQLRWLPSDTVTVDFSVSGSKTRQKARALKCIVVDDIPSAGWQAALQDPSIVIPSTGQSIAEHCADSEELDRDEVILDLDNNNYEVDVLTGAATVEWEISDNVSLKSITAWRETDAGQSDELDAIGITLLSRSNFDAPISENRVTEQFSQELQFAGSAFDDRVEYVVGAFAFAEESTAGIANGRTGPFFGSLGAPNIAFFLNNATELKSDNVSASAFSQVDWNFTENWRLTLGLRYTWEERELERNVFVPDESTLAVAGAAPATELFSSFYDFPDGPDSYNPNHLHLLDTDPISQQAAKVDDSRWTPMASIQYLFDGTGAIDSGTVFFTYSEGFLSGGLSESLDIFTLTIPTYEPELVTNYELGFKMDGFDRRLRLNTALFHMEYTDRQLTSVRVNPQTGQIAGTTINAAESTISGFELETTILPTPNLELTFNAAYNKGEIDEYDDVRLVIPGSLPDSACQFVPSPGVDVCAVDRSDEDLPRLPEQTYFAAIQYTFQTGIGNIVPRLQYSFRKDVDNCFDRASCLSGLYKVDQEDWSVRLTWMSTENNWRVTLWGDNLTDERYITGGVPLVDVTETAGVIYNMPRTYGLEASFAW